MCEYVPRFRRFSLPSDPQMPGGGGNGVGTSAGIMKSKFSQKKSPVTRRGAAGKYAATFMNDEDVSVFEDARSELDEIKVHTLGDLLSPNCTCFCVLLFCL